MTPPTKHMITWVDPRRRDALRRRRQEHRKMPMGVRNSTAQLRWKRVQSDINTDERAATRTLVLSAKACQGLRWLFQANKGTP